MRRELLIDWIEFSHGRNWVNSSIGFWVYSKVWGFDRALTKIADRIF